MSADRFRSSLSSPLQGVADPAWARFVATLEVQPIRASSPSGGFGSYDLRPRRLVELGYARNLRTVTTTQKRQVYACDFVSPWTLERFLGDPLEQYRVLVKSISLYHESLKTGEIRMPEGVSMAGALVVLHRGGRGALRAWPRLFEQTRALYETAKEAF